MVTQVLNSHVSLEPYLYAELVFDSETTKGAAIGQNLLEVHHAKVGLFFRNVDHFTETCSVQIHPPQDPRYVEVYMNYTLDYLFDLVLQSYELVSCTCSNVEHSKLLGFIFQLKNVGWKSNKNWFGLCCDSWVKFDVASKQFCAF